MRLILKLSFIFFVSVVSSNILLSQISTEEEPISFSYDENIFRANDANLKVMPPLDLEKLRIEDEDDEKNYMPPRFGFPHKVDFNLENSGEWFSLPKWR